MKEKIAAQLGPILAAYDPTTPHDTADKLRDLWLQFEPKSMEGIKAELRERQETVGIPVPVLKTMGKGMSKPAREAVKEFLPLARALWNEGGREGRVVGVILLGTMELVDPEQVIPLLKDLCRSCVTWEDADRLAMDALEPVIRKKPGKWLSTIESWLVDENKWVRRAGITVVGRLPMKHPEYTVHCLELAERLLLDEEVDVKMAVSFAVRLSARGEIGPVREFLERHVPPDNSVATWVLCDTIRSMTKAFLPELLSLLPVYEEWAADPFLSAGDRKSVESAVSTLRKAQG